MFVLSLLNAIIASLVVIKGEGLTSVISSSPSATRNSTKMLLESQTAIPTKADVLPTPDAGLETTSGNKAYPTNTAHTQSSTPEVTSAPSRETAVNMEYSPSVHGVKHPLLSSFDALQSKNKESLIERASIFSSSPSSSLSTSSTSTSTSSPSPSPSSSSSSTSSASASTSTSQSTSTSSSRSSPLSPFLSSSSSTAKSTSSSSSSSLSPSSSSTSTSMSSSMSSSLLASSSSSFLSSSSSSSSQSSSLSSTSTSSTSSTSTSTPSSSSSLSLTSSTSTSTSTSTSLSSSSSSSPLTSTSSSSSSPSSLSSSSSTSTSKPTPTSTLSSSSSTTTTTTTTTPSPSLSSQSQSFFEEPTSRVKPLSSPPTFLTNSPNSLTVAMNVRRASPSTTSTDTLFPSRTPSTVSSSIHPGKTVSVTDTRTSENPTTMQPSERPEEPTSREPAEAFEIWAATITIENMEFTPELKNSSSKAFKDLASDLKMLLSNIFEEISGFLSVEVESFESGSVICSFSINTKVGSSATAKEFEKALGDSANTGKTGNYHITSVEVKDNVQAAKGAKPKDKQDKRFHPLKVVGATIIAGGLIVIIVVLIAKAIGKRRRRQREGFLKTVEVVPLNEFDTVNTAGEERKPALPETIMTDDRADEELDEDANEITPFYKPGYVQA